MTNDNGNSDENNSIGRYLESVWRSVTHTLEKFKIIEVVGGSIAIIIAFMTFGTEILDCLPQSWKEPYLHILSIMTALGLPFAVNIWRRQAVRASKSYEAEKQKLENNLNIEKTKFEEKERRFFEDLEQWRHIVEKSSEVLWIEGKNRILEEVKESASTKCREVIFFGNFGEDYKKVLCGDGCKIIVCDTKPEIHLLSDQSYDYRFLYTKFAADLFVFQYGESNFKSIFVFSSEDGVQNGWIVKFDLSKTLGFNYEHYPKLRLPVQITHQIKCDIANSPIIERASYRSQLSADAFVHDEFSLVLKSVSNGYMKPIFPPTNTEGVIKSWNEKIFQNFIGYASDLIKDSKFKKLFITWKIDIESPQTIEANEVFKAWINKLNTAPTGGNGPSVDRVILVDKNDIGKTKKIPIEGQNYEHYGEIVRALTEKVILKDLNNPNYRYCFADMSSTNFPEGCNKDFAVFLFSDGRAIIQTSELDVHDELLKLFFRSPENGELSKYMDFFEKCFGTPKPVYVYTDIESALQIAS